MTNSRLKGKTGELYFVHALKEIFPKVHRNWLEQSAKGGIDLSDTGDFDFEIKVGKQCNIKKVLGWLTQLEKEGNPEHFKTILCKYQRKEYAIMSFNDFMLFLEFLKNKRVI